MNQALFRLPLALLLTGILAWSATASVSGNAGFAVAFQTPSSTVAEDVGTLFLTLVLAGPSGQTLTSPVDATVSYLDGTATDGVDLEILVATVTFATGSAPGAQQSVTVRVIDDPVKETDERARLEIGAVTGGVSAGATPIHALKITNDDAQVWSVRFDGTFAGGNGSSVDEGGAPVTIDVVIDGPPGTPTPQSIVVTIAPSRGGILDVDGADATPGVDFTHTAEVTFAAGAVSGDTEQVEFSPIEDALRELDDEFATLRIAGVTGPAVVGDPDEWEFRITNGTDPAPDPPPGVVVVGWGIGGSAIPEGVGTFNIPLSHDAVPAEAAAVVLNVSLAGVNDADVGVDFTFPATVTIPPDSPAASVSVAVTIIDDALPEKKEYFHLGLSVASGSAVVRESTFGGQIVDDDGFAFTTSISGSFGFPAEAQGAHSLGIVLVADAGPGVPIPEDAVLQVSLLNTTAVPGLDLIVVTPFVTFPAGSVDGDTQPVWLQLFTDSVEEGSESFSFFMEHVSGPVDPSFSIGSTFIVNSVGPLTVNSEGDAPDASVGDDSCDTGSTIDRDGTPETECTLRAAIQEANAGSTADTINFDIPVVGVPSIGITSALPALTRAITIDGTTQTGGRVGISGTAAGASVDGLTLSAGPQTLDGLKVSGFLGSGVVAQDGVELSILSGSLTGNCGWGVEAAGTLNIGELGSLPLDISANGSGAGCNAGGVLGNDLTGGSEITATNVAIAGNDGPGILALGNIILASVSIDSNGGEGARAMGVGSAGGGVSVTAGQGNKVTNNSGVGLRADGKVTVVNAAIEVSGNGAWGIRTRDGNISINVNAAPGAQPATKVNGNGNGTSCSEWTIDAGNGAANETSVPCVGGGIVRTVESADSDAVQIVEIVGNAGPGVLTVAHLSMTEVVINDNAGDGIRSQNVGVDGGWVTIDRGDANEVKGNQGVGIYADQGVVLTMGATDVSNNGAWGIRVDTGNIQINPTPADLGNPVSKVNGNGKGTTCFAWDVGLAATISSATIACSGGGMLRTDESADPDLVRNVQVNANGGPGVLTVARVDLVSATANDNEGDGVRSLNLGADGGLVTVGEGNAVELMRNKGHGLRADGGVTFATVVVDLSDNGMWGLRVDDGAASLNAALTSGAPQVTASGNGTGAGCFDWTVLDDEPVESAVACAGGGVRVVLGQLNAGFLVASGNASDGVDALSGVDAFRLTSTNNQGDGVVSGQGSVEIDRATVSDNTGVGIDAGLDVALKQGEVCRNGAGGVIAEETVTIDQVLVCNNTGHGIRVGTSSGGPSAFTASFPLAAAAGSPTSSSVSGSTLTGNAGHGLLLQSTLGLTITNSNITSNGGSGVQNDTGATVSAKDNWWGDASGPGGDGPGSGDEITGSADFSGFLSAAVTLVASIDPSSLTITAGESGSARLFVRNWQDLVDTVDVSVTDPRGWLSTVATLALALAQGVADTELTFDVPGGTSLGTVDGVTVDVQSQATPASTSSVTLTVQTPTAAPTPVPGGSGLGLVVLGALLAGAFAWAIAQRPRLARGWAQGFEGPSTR